MAWTTPRTWVVGDIVTAAMMNANVRDNTQALSDYNASQIVAVAAGTKSIGATYTITAPAAGTYTLEFGAGIPNTVVGGSTAHLTSNLGGDVYYSDSGPGGGTALVAGLVLTNGQVITITCATIGGSAGMTLLGCWAKLTRTA